MANLYTLLFLLIILLTSCQYEPTHRDDIRRLNRKESFREPLIFNISTTRSLGNTLSRGELRSLSNSNPLAPRETECGEFVILPQDIKHIWIGNILHKSSLSTATYKPIICRRNPLTVSLTLAGSTPRVIEKPSPSEYSKYLQESLNISIVPQSRFFQLSIDQFSSYEELKAAYGYNVSTSFIIGKQNTSRLDVNHRIRKTTGLYVRFLQTSFRAMLDYPDEGIGDIPEALIDSAVYINSISYGRLGVLAVETNVQVDEAYRKLEKSFNVLFVNGSKHLDIEDKKFLDSCTFTLFTAGGNSEQAVKTFEGYDAFLEHVANNTFSKSSPGVPILYTLNNASDDSSFRCRFKIQTFRDPIYVQLVQKLDSKNPYKADYSLNFYRTKSRIPTIPPDDIEFVVEKWRETNEGHNLENRISIFNTYLHPSVDIERGVYIPMDDYISFGDGTIPCFIAIRDGYYYKLLPSKDGSYEIIN